MTDFKVSWSYGADELEAGEVVVGTHRYPARVALEATGRNGAPNVRIVFALRNGVPETIDFSVTSSPGGRGVRTTDLNYWNLKSWAAKAYQLHAHPVSAADATLSRDWSDGTVEEWAAVRRELDAARSKRRPPSDAELRLVAKVYRDAMAGPDGKRGKPTEAVELALGTSRRTAARRVEQAREKGMLPPTTQGKVSG